MTRDEAKQKWCPLAYSNNRPGANRFDGEPNAGPASLRCVADHCMMWREDMDGGWCGLAGTLPVLPSSPILEPIAVGEQKRETLTLPRK